jgi:hypothetical protein
MADGTRWGFYSYDAPKNNRIYVFVDLNGEKGPNTFGTDVFEFVIANAPFSDTVDTVSAPGVYYHGTGKTRAECLANCKSKGWGCTALIVMDGDKINY